MHSSIIEERTAATLLFFLPSSPNICDKNLSPICPSESQISHSLPSTTCTGPSPSLLPSALSTHPSLITTKKES